MMSDFSLKKKHTQLYLYKCIKSNFKVNHNLPKLKNSVKYSIFFFSEITKLNEEANKIRAAEQPEIKLYVPGSRE